MVGWRRRKRWRVGGRKMKKEGNHSQRKPILNLQKALSKSYSERERESEKGRDREGGGRGQAQNNNNNTSERERKKKKGGGVNMKRNL